MRIILPLISVFLLFSCVYAQENPNAHNGKTIKEINIKTLRIHPDKVKRKFLLNEGDVFYSDNYDFAKQAVHDMRIFRTVDFFIMENDGSSISINIDAKDSYYVFPVIFGSGGSKSTLALALIEANLFKRSEAVFLMGAFNTDGYATSGGFGLNDNFFGVSVSGFKYDEKVFEDGSYSVSGLFSPSKSGGGSNVLTDIYKVKSDSVKLSWSKSFKEKAGFTAGFDFSEVKYSDSGYGVPDDSGSHNKIYAAFRKYKNIQTAGGMSSMGALFGVGLSDIKDKLADLKKTKYGYFAEVSYENAGRHTGSGFALSKTYLKTRLSAETKKRHVLTLNVSAAAAFEAPYYDRVRSGEVLSGKGIYARDFRGEKGFGTGISLIYYFIKNKTGVAAIVPFAESAVISDSGKIRSRTGIGAGISYRLWRIPFPLGINYTYDASAGDYDISFFFGG
ncbi:MAG: hypothetical protein LBR69_05715 [Endomicrobium sp.]|jgi:hypothetical protein|nr:hypothetical protein [Endomicrobium sp.]